MTNIRLSVVLVMLAGMFLFLQYCLWFESGGIIDMVKAKKVLAMQVAENERLKKRNEQLLFQVERLRSSQDAAESRARNELGMIKKGEVFYQVVK